MITRIAVVALSLLVPIGAIRLQLGSQASQGGLNAPAFETTVGGCPCDMQQLECWPSADCFQTYMQESHQRIAEGHEIRKSLKASTNLQSGGHPFALPIGKHFQYGTIENWGSWLKSNRIAGFNANQANEYLQELQKDEDVATVELIALQKANGGNQNFSDVRQRILKGENSPDDTLLAFAHLMRVMFNRQPRLRDAYDSHITRVNPDNTGKEKLRVALHVRRADSCDHHHDGFQVEASPLDSAPQMSGVRNCYDTSIYIDRLARIYDEFKLPLEVYLATDDSESVIGQIEKAAASKNTGSSLQFIQQYRTETLSALSRYQAVIGDLKSRRNDIYKNTEFRYLNYPRERFDYKGMVESQFDVQHGGGGEEENKFLIETGMGDLWHLSHGQFFIGSLGSRFSKASYLLAAARHNSAIPYASVDGHNLCCEIDEQCANANTVMKSMSDCLSFAHELNPSANMDNYWTKGSLRPGLA